jgi:DUF971 family protein
VAGKKNVMIIGVEPVGSYAVKLVFDDSPAREALDLQAEIEALDRAISDEESLADRPKGAT